MTDFANTNSESLAPSAYRQAKERMRAFLDTDAPAHIYPNRMYLNPHLGFDWERLALECPGVAQSIRLSIKENNGEVILPPAVYHDLLERGLLVWIDDEEPA